MLLEFTKMEATGNDYIYFDFTGRDLPSCFLPDFIQKISDRRTGIGGDGAVAILTSGKGATALMRMWNADGSESAICGNALRSVAYFLFKKDGNREFYIESGAGLHKVRMINESGDGEGIIEVDMGNPVFTSARVPVIPEKIGIQADPAVPLLMAEADFGHYGKYRISTVSMGNPHCVIFTEDADTAPVEELGAYIESHPAFPERTNVEFVSINPDGTLRQRTYERGSGETLSCGTGACAVLAVSAALGKGPSRNKIHLKGGTLELDWTGSFDKPGVMFLRGPARFVFTGRIECS